MKTKYLSIFAICLISITAGQVSYLDTMGIGLFRGFKEFVLRVVGSTGTEGSIQIQAARKERRLQDRIRDDVPFPCNVSAGRSKSVPTSVHKLRPGDIDVIAAMGDSLTAGLGAFSTNIVHVVIENRGVAALGGGQGTWRDYLTLPNIIKEFNPNLIGFSSFDSPTHYEESEFNVAELGAMSRDLPFMAETLVRRMKSHPKVDIKNQWKLISILIGPNDFCSNMCWISSGPWSVLKSHRADIIAALRILKKNLPRTLVSLIPPPNLTVISSLKRKSFICTISHLVACSCLTGLRNNARIDEYSEIMSRWQKIDEEVATYPEFKAEDFAVVAQPFGTNLTIPTKPDGTTDWRYLTAECFHLSQLGNARVTFAAWKNMLEMVGKKSRSWEKITTLSCPTESRPYIATAANS